MAAGDAYQTYAIVSCIDGSSICCLLQTRCTMLDANHCCCFSMLEAPLLPRTTSKPRFHPKGPGQWASKRCWPTADSLPPDCSADQRHAAQQVPPYCYAVTTTACAIADTGAAAAARSGPCCASACCKAHQHTQNCLAGPTAAGCTDMMAWLAAAYL